MALVAADAACSKPRAPVRTCATRCDRRPRHLNPTLGILRWGKTGYPSKVETLDEIMVHGHEILFFCFVAVKGGEPWPLHAGIP